MPRPAPCAIETGFGKAECDRSARGLGCEAMAPKRERETPADLNTGGEVRLERGNLQPHEPDERGDSGNLDRPQAKTAFCGLRHDSFVYDGVRLVPGEGGRVMLHDARIHVERCERREVLGSPAT